MLLALSCVAHAIVTDPHDIDLSPGSLHGALIALGRLADVTIIFPSSIPDSPDSPAVKGRFSALQSLQQLIESRDLEYRIIGPDTLVVLPRCRSARDCASARDELDLSIHQYPLIEELIVRGTPMTGSRFRQINAGGFAPVEITSSTEIRLSGAQTLSEIMRFTPAVVGNSASTAVNNGGNGTADVTLRGLPASNTLVLVNGRRVAVNAIDGSAVDLNGIPLAAVDHIEILKDSGSSVYGSDAIAGVVNIILKKEFKGLLLNGFYGESSRGDNTTRRVDLIGGMQLPALDFLFTASHYEQDGIFSRDRSISRSADGRSRGGIDRRAQTAIPARFELNGQILTLDRTADGFLPGDTATDYRPANEADLFDSYKFTSTVSPVERDSVYLRGELNHFNAVDAIFELAFEDGETSIIRAPAPVASATEMQPFAVASGAAFNPFATQVDDVKVRFPQLGNRTQLNEAQHWRAVASVLGNFFDGEWQLAANYSESRVTERQSGLIDLQHLALGVAASGACASDSQCIPVNIFAAPGNLSDEQIGYIAADAKSDGLSRLMALNFDISQRADILPAGDVEVAAGLELRRENLRTRADDGFAEGALIGASFADSDASRDTVELYMESLLPLASNLPAVYSLEANLSFRISYTDDFSDNASPRLAFRYRPFEQLMLRASLSRGYRAPSLFELSSTGLVEQLQLSDPCSIASNVGALPGCSVQTDFSRLYYSSVTFGNSELEPETSSNLSYGLIYTPDATRDLRISVDFFNIRVKDVIRADAQAAIDNNAFGFSGAPVLRNSAGEIVTIETRFDNLGTIRVSGVDLDASWRLLIPYWGTLGINMSTTHLSRYSLRTNDGARSMDLEGSFVDSAAQGYGALPRWRSRLNLFWQFGRWELALSSLYVSSIEERLPLNEVRRDTGAWSRQDMQVNYHFNSGESLATFGVHNVLDEMPPFMGSAVSDNFDVRTYDVTGRFWYMRISHRI